MVTPYISGREARVSRMGSARAGSNPASDVFFFLQFFPFSLSTASHSKSKLHFLNVRSCRRVGTGVETDANFLGFSVMCMDDHVVI